MNQEICSICYCDFNRTNFVNDTHSTECNHQFHKICIKTWYESKHPSSKSCPICRSTLNFLGFELVSDNALSYEEFIKLDGVCIFYNYVLINMNSPNWKNLLKNLLVLITISQQNEHMKNINRTKLFIKGNNADMKFGFILNNVKFTVQKYNSVFNNVSTIKPKFSLTEINDEQFQNLKCLDNILLKIANDDVNQYSLIKHKNPHNYVSDNIGDIQNNPIITNNNAKIIANMHLIAKQYDILNHTECNYENYTYGECSVMLVPDIIKVNNNIHYRLTCVEFALINGNKPIDVKIND